MGASVLADFVGWLDAETLDTGEPVEGRVLLNGSRLVLVAGEGERTSIPLSAVVDVNVGTAPRMLGPFPGTPVTVAYHHSDDRGRSVAVVAADDDSVEKFVTVLFKTILQGRSVTLRHPARLGGRVLDTDFRAARLRLAGGAISFDTDPETVTVEPASVTDFARETRTVGGSERPVVVVSHVQDGRAHRTVVATESPRALAILGRYLRRHYDRLLRSLGSLSLSEPKVETLVTLYATRTDAALPSVVDADAATVRRLLRSLYGDRLIERTPDGPRLTTRGQVVVNHYLERVNG